MAVSILNFKHGHRPILVVIGDVLISVRIHVWLFTWSIQLWRRRKWEHQKNAALNSQGQTRIARIVGWTTQWDELNRGFFCAWHTTNKSWPILSAEKNLPTFLDTVGR